MFITNHSEHRLTSGKLAVVYLMFYIIAVLLYATDTFLSFIVIIQVFYDKLFFKF